MKKNSGPSFKFTLRTGDGATLNGSGPCTDREAFAIYMIGLAPKADTPIGKALATYLDECGKALENKKPAPTVGHIWREKTGRHRIARIDELHDTGFGETPRAVLTVLDADGDAPFRKNLRLCRNVFAMTWEFLRVE